MLVVTFPYRLKRDTMYDLLNQVINADNYPRDYEIHFDFTRLGFIEPVGVTVLANLVEWLMKLGVQVVFKHNIFRDSNKYLDDSLFFEKYLLQKLHHTSTPRATTIPLQAVTYQSSYQWLDWFIQWLSQRLSMNMASLLNIRTCMEEIFNNIKDHSKENLGCVFAQHFPQKESGIVSIAISDFGVGIPVTMAQRYYGLTDSQAISQATMLGVSSQTTPQNRGAGLGVLINNVVLNNRGNVYIHSNHGILNCKYNSGGVDRITQNTSGYYPGTLIEIEMRTDTIEYVHDDGEEFEW
ncbi:ATP-binding protein [Tumebacillus lipolyticus]|uniref:ATP-binding protein n=1 Tax=Tumebacillus lipolyticus TaxID=1280370 RepID=A0ABW5A4M0_9BACL